MSSAPARLETVDSPFAARRRRAEALLASHAFASEVLTLYLALLPVQEEAWDAAIESPPGPEEIPRSAATRVVPAVVEATAAAGPPALRDAVLAHPAGAELEAVLGGWLAGAELDPVDRYLARASLTPVLEALGDRAGTACDGRHEGEGGIRCPSCGGQPQLSYLASSGDSLAAGQRSLLCARCNSSWSCSRSTCPACAQTDEAQLTVYSEHWEGGVSGNGKGEHEPQPTFPHLRVAGCESCRRYLIEVDLGRDARAVPEVDELVALPLDLYAAEQQLTKVTPNLMGF